VETWVGIFIWQEGSRHTCFNVATLLLPLLLVHKKAIVFLFKTVLKQNGPQDLEKNGAEEDQDEISKADPEMTPFEICLKDKRYMSL